MKDPKSCAKLLGLLSAIDGEADPSEAEVMTRHLVVNFKEVSSEDMQGILESLASEGISNLEQDLKETAEKFYKNSTPQERIKFLDSALALIAADGKLTTEEAALFTLICKLWDIDPIEYLRKYSKS